VDNFRLLASDFLVLNALMLLIDKLALFVKRFEILEILFKNLSTLDFRETAMAFLVSFLTFFKA